MNSQADYLSTISKIWDKKSINKTAQYDLKVYRLGRVRARVCERLMLLIAV